MKQLFIALAALIWMTASFALSENSLTPNSCLESNDGIQITLEDIYVQPSENESTQPTHGWIVIDVQIINFAVEDITIAEALSGKLTYQNKYIFDAHIDFDHDTIRPLVRLEGRIIFEVPMLVIEAEPGNFTVEISVNGITYPFEIPVTAVESVSMSSEGQSVDTGAFVPSNTKLRFDWSATGDVEEYLVTLEDWQLDPLFTLRQQENWFELDLSLLPPGDCYYLVVLPQPCFDLWTPYIEDYCSFFILKPTPSPEPSPTISPMSGSHPQASPEQIIVYRTTNGKWYHTNENCSGMSGGKPYPLSECQGLQPCQKCNAPDLF